MLYKLWFFFSFKVFEFADKHRGAYSSSLRRAVCPFYCDVNGFQVKCVCVWSPNRPLGRSHTLRPEGTDAARTRIQDELLWGAAWLHKASRRRKYREYIMRNEITLHAGDTINEFGWDNKHAGINVLISKVIYTLSIEY